MSGPKKVSATSTKKGVEKWLESVAMPTNYLPYRWNFMLSVVGMLILCTGAFMVIRANTGETQRLALAELTKRVNPQGNAPANGDCYYHYRQYGLQGRRSLDSKNRWTSQSDSDKVYLTPSKELLSLPNNLAICSSTQTGGEAWKDEWCFNLRVVNSDYSGRAIWHLKDVGYLECAFPDEYWYEYVYKQVSLQFTVLQRDSPVCAIYFASGTITLTEGSEWKGNYETTFVFLRWWENDLVLEIYSRKNFKYAFHLQLPDSTGDVPEVLAWIPNGLSYLECKPAHQFLGAITRDQDKLRRKWMSK